MKSSIQLLRDLLFVASFISPTIALPTAAPCDKSLLSSAADAYITSLTAGSLASLKIHLAQNYTYKENNVVTSPTSTSSILTKPLPVAHRRTIHDLVACATYTEIIITDGPGYVVGTQIHHADSGEVQLVDSIISTTGSWLFDAKKTLGFVINETWSEIEVGKRDKREVIKAAGDAYMDMWSNATSSNAVPWGTPCVRLEGSSYTGKGKPDDSCKPGIPSNHNQKPNSDRRYVIDEVMGSVSILCVWEHMMNAADSHEFRLEGGKLRYVHTMTSCGDKACKL